MRNSSNQSLEAEPLPIIIAADLASSLHPARWTINPASRLAVFPDHFGAACNPAHMRPERIELKIRPTRRWSCSKSTARLGFSEASIFF
jgi:hypothetical protein